MYQILDQLTDEAFQTPFFSGGKTYTFPVVEKHKDDEYTRWDEQQPHALNPSLGIITQFDDATDRFLFLLGRPSVTKEIVRRGIITPANAPTILEVFDALFPPQ